jgi:hypothetical protein
MKKTFLVTLSATFLLAGLGSAQTVSGNLEQPTEQVVAGLSTVSNTSTLDAENAGGAKTENSSSTSTSEVWELDPGVRVPVAFIEPEEPVPPQVAAANQRIAQEFQDAIAAEGVQASDGSIGVPENVWKAALEWADVRYQIFYGYEKYRKRQLSCPSSSA